MKKLIVAASAFIVGGTASAVELTWDFETANPFNRFTPVQWGARDADFTYGPRGPYNMGSQWVGHPVDDIAVYGGSTTATLATTDIDLAAYGFDALYISWAHWGDFEGQALNFDGAQLQISVNGGSFVGVDDPPAGTLNPAYDQRIVNGGGTPLSGKWAWCWDTTVGGLSDEGRPLPMQAPLYYVAGFERPVQPSPAAVDVGWRSVATGDLIADGYCTASDVIQLRWIFASDQLEGGQGYFIDDLRIANTAPDCTIPPNVASDALSDTPETGMGYEVNATITRVCSDVDPTTAFLHYQVEDTDADSTLMVDNGDGTFSGEIPAQELDTDIWYWVSAHDMAGNRGSTLTQTFEVTEAITLALDDGQPFYIDPSFFAADDGRAVRFAAAGGDTTYQLYKMLMVGAAEGQLDVGVWDDDGANGNPATRIYSSGPVSNAANDWWAYEFSDSSLVYDEGHMYVGFTFVTGDSLDNPLLSGDPEANAPNSQWALVGGSWANISGQGSTEGMLRVKVKAMVSTDVAGDGAPAGPATAFKVHGNFPNPFNPRTVIRYDLPTEEGPTAVRVYVFDLAGRRLATLVDEVQEPGAHAVTWEGRTEKGDDVPSGVYFYRVEAGTNVATRKMVILK